MVYKLHAHIVLTPKYRRKVMTGRVSADLHASFDEVCGRYGATLDEFETDQDHAHLLVSYPPRVCLSVDPGDELKTISSMRVRAHQWPEVTHALWGKHFWSPSYAVISCGGAPLDMVAEYIRNQQSPNRRRGRPKDAQAAVKARYGLSSP